MKPLKALIISNATVGSNKLFQSNEHVSYDIYKVTENFDPDLDGYDLLILPNGATDSVAMAKIKHKVRAFLDEGNALFCFSGWFTNWVPGNRWIMDNSLKTSEVRYFKKYDRYDLLKDVDIDGLIFSHGISGWWACGYIETAPGAEVILEDTLQRPVVIIDEKTTRGTIIVSASGPVAEVTYGTTNHSPSMQAISALYRNFIAFVQHKKQTSYEKENRIDL